MSGINPNTHIPYSTTDTLEVMEGTQAQYNGAMSRWRDRATTPEISSHEPYPTGTCIRPNTGAPPDILFRDFISKSKRYRESLGGRGCQCRPMGELCLPNICNCSEICPNDHGIFQSQASQIMPDEYNQLAFPNTDNNNGNGDGAFATYPNKDGYCTGMQLQRRKFSSLARFRPTQRSWPAMVVPSPEYITYIKGEIDRMTQGLDPNFLGATDLEDLRRKDPAIDNYFKQKTGAGDLPPTSPEERRAAAILNPGNLVTHGDGVSYRPRNGGTGEVTLHFGEQTTTNITAKTAVDTDIDPVTGTAYGSIPICGTPQYESYLAKKVERISQGFPATLPGYANLFTLSSHPTYKEIIGRYSAIDWQQMNGFDDLTTPQRPPFHAGNINQSYSPMNTSESDSLLEGLEERLPAYPGSGTGAWNASGPWQGVSLEFMGSFDPTKTNGSGNGSYYHSVEAYALQRLSSGEVHVCIGDPNLMGTTHDTQNSNCNNYMTIPAKDSTTGQRAGMSYNSSQFNPTSTPRVLGKVGIQPSSDRYEGLMTTRMVEYCRTINHGKFNVQDCGGAP